MADVNGNKTGGRQKGTPNKDTQYVIDKARELGCDPIEFLIFVIKNDPALKDTADLNQRLKAAQELASYMYPKRKAIEHTGKDGEPLASVEDVIRAALAK